MFITNKYTTIYHQLIQRAIERNSGDEEHHIIPKSLGGSNESDNLVCLTSREHYIAHALLVRMVESRQHLYKMFCAFNMMHVGHNGRRYTSRLYEYHKKKFYKLHSEMQKGHKRSEESKRKQSEKTKGKPWSEKKRASAKLGPTAKPVIAYKKDGAYVGTYESLSAVSRELNCDLAAVWKICNGWESRAPDGKMRPYKSHRGYTFKFA